MNNYDFSGWATRHNLRCSDGRTITTNAFKHNNGKKVPLMYSHNHDDVGAVLGHAILEHRDEGMYAYGSFNESPGGIHAKYLIEHGDIEALSIFANKLEEHNSSVMHGEIREVSLVMAGANPGAFIESVIVHGEEDSKSARIYTGESIAIRHAETSSEVTEASKKSDESQETVGDVFNTFNEKQKTVVYALIGEALDETNTIKQDDNKKGDDSTMKHNVFYSDAEGKENTLSHSEMTAVIKDAKRLGSMKESVIQHGITDIDYLFPDNKNVTTAPEFIKRDTTWVQKVLGAVHHTPFSRIKTTFADLTEDDARALGYIKGNLKKEEVFTLLKRTTDPTTVYKKQKMHRDDVIDITDFDVIAWLKQEMRFMLDEEIGRAILVGDGRLSSSDDKINEQYIRPVWTDADLYTIKTSVDYSASATSATIASNFITACIKSRKDYKGSGNPTLYTTEDILTDCLLLTDTTGRDLYDSVDKLATKLRVKEIVTVPVMEDHTRDVVDGDTTTTKTLLGIILNLSDYNIGADKGGAINMFDDFDIDYNAQKYLIETRCSGALIKPYSAIVIEVDSAVVTDSDD